MSLRSEGKDVDWASADLEVDDTPVEEEEWQDWLRSEPKHVWPMLSLLELELPREGIPTYAQVLHFVLEQVPSLAPKFVGTHSNPVRRAIEHEVGGTLGRLSQGEGQLSWADAEDDELIGEWLAGHLEKPKVHLNPHTLKELNRREQIGGALLHVYPALALQTLKAVRKGNPSEISLRSDWLDVNGIDAILKVLRTKPANLDSALGQLVEQGTPQGLEAIAGLLADKKVGDTAVFWLACAGHAGLHAARTRWAEGKGAKLKLANSQIDALAALPMGSPRVSTPRYLLRSDLSPWEPDAAISTPTASADAPEPALARDTITKMCTGWSSPQSKRADLSDEEWADYLQITSLDDNLVHPGPTWDRAREAGWLGRGGSREHLLAAARRLNPRGRTHWHRESKIGWGHLFLWAGADRATYVEALVLCLRDAWQRRLMGWLDEHWVKPLNEMSPPWASEVSDWLERIRQGRPWLGQVHERPSDEVVCWDPAKDAFVGLIPSGGRARFTVGEQQITIEPGQGLMTLTGSIAGERRFPPTIRALPVAVTRSDVGVMLTFGSVAWGELGSATDRISAEGLEHAALHHEMQPMWGALAWLLRDDTGGATALAATQSEEAARLLALVAMRRPEVMPDAVRAALGELGPHAAAYRALLGIDAEPPTLPERSFGEVVDALLANTGGSKQEEREWCWASGHGQRRGGFVGPALRLLDSGALPDAAELQLLASECPLYPYRADAGPLQFRDTLGVRELTWRLVPEDGGFGNGPIFYQIEAACWPVKDGLALALWSGYDVPSVHWLMGVPYLPAAEWRAA